MSSVTLSPAFGIRKTPRFNTAGQETAALAGSVYISLADFPLWDFVLELKQQPGRLDDITSPIAQLMGIFFACKGKAGTFLLSDPSDNTVLEYQFGLGDGVSKAFLLTRPIGDLGTDIVQNPDTITVSVSGTPTALYSIDNRGVITFNTPPALNAPITWHGTFSYRLRFLQDSFQDLTNFFTNNWNITTLELTSCIL
jgi:hypothetical protein